VCVSVVSFIGVLGNVNLLKNLQDLGGIFDIPSSGPWMLFAKLIDDDRLVLLSLIGNSWVPVFSFIICNFDEFILSLLLPHTTV